MVVFLQTCATTKLRSHFTVGKSAITQSAAAGNSHKLTYFELSKASVVAGLYQAAKSCYSISECVLRWLLILKLISSSKILSEVSTSTNAADIQTSARVIQQTQLTNQ